MDRPSFDEAVRLAGEHYEFAQAAGPESAVERHDRRPWVIALLIRDAATDPAAWNAVKAIAQRLLRANEPLPATLAAWIADALNGTRPRTGRPGRPRTNRVRDAAIVRAIRELRAQGLQPTRNIVADACSGCDAVASAFGLNYKTVEGVWARFRQWEEEEIPPQVREWLGLS